MKILFISSGNSGAISPIVKAQSESLIEKGVAIDYFLIHGKGIKGYFKSIFKLRKFLKNNKYDLFHAHYSLTAFVASLAGCKPLIVSLMGSDVKKNNTIKPIIKFFSKYIWKKTIVKSDDMKTSLGIKNVKVIPNGVNLSIFHPIDKNEAQKNLNWDNNKIHLLFAANPNRLVKNFSLVKSVFNELNDANIELHTLENVPFNLMNTYYNASDAILLSSLWEGSPNVIKESLACNKPLLSTDVGDVKLNFEQVNGVFISTHNQIDYLNNLQKLINFVKEKKESNGRTKIKELNLDAESIASQLLEIYRDK